MDQEFPPKPIFACGKIMVNIHLQRGMDGGPDDVRKDLERPSDEGLSVGASEIESPLEIAQVGISFFAVHIEAG
jgi:hypothetical protein